MCTTNKNFISALVCASAIAALAIVDPSGITRTHQVVQAATDNVPAKSTGVDVSSWQGKDLTQDAQAGSQFAVVKVSEGTKYQNPNAQAQILSTKQNNMMPMAYHYAHFGSDSSQAIQEASYAISSAKTAGLTQGSYLALDWEQDPNNNTNNEKEANTSAIISFMDIIHNGGYSPMLYSNESLLRNKVDINEVTSKYKNSLWVASYKYGSGIRQDSPDYNYFPSMDNVAIWQYTDNWHGQNVDGNVTALPLSINVANNQSAPIIQNNNDRSSTQAPTNDSGTWTMHSGTFITGGAINLRTKASTNSSIIAQLSANTEIQYDAYCTIGNYTWLRQPRANGQYGYLVGRNNGQAWGTFDASNTVKPEAPTNNSGTWTMHSGTFITGGAINLRTKASTNSSIIATLPINTTVKYDAYYHIGNYVWLRQPRANGQYGYLVGCLNNETWGTYK